MEATSIDDYLRSISSRRAGHGSESRKTCAILIIAMMLLGSGFLLFMNAGFLPPQVTASVRVAVLDSGLESSVTLQGRVVAEKSFVLSEYGYEMNDTSTTDSSPEGVPHGSLVAYSVASDSPNALIVNAKVVGSNGQAATGGIVAAISWAVEQNCSVINLSLGGSASFGDPLREAVRWAFSQGVIVVASAGNEGEGGMAGSSLSSPAVYENVLAVGATDEYGSPAEYSSWGPTAERYVKPDIVAPGYIQTPSAVYYGTSFAAPRVAAAAAELVALCTSSSVSWTPGLVMAALLKGASTMAFPEYIVGAGLLNLQHSKDLIEQALAAEDISSMTYVRPLALPLDFERLFLGDTYTFNLQVITASLNTFETVISESPDGFIHADATIEANQSSFVPLTLTLPSSGASHFEGNITFLLDDVEQGMVSLEFDATAPAARIAFDISHTAWSIDTTYGQFKELYRELVNNDISVTEIRNSSATSSTLLNNYDAVFILDPCSWDINETDYISPRPLSLPFSEQEIQAYQDYFDGGGGIFIAALSNESVDVKSLNDFLAWSGFSLDFNRVANLFGDTVLIDNITANPVTAGVSDFDYLGAGIEVPELGTVLAWYHDTLVLGSLQGPGGGRLVVSGSNFFVDNWGMLHEYESTHNAILALKIALWVTHLI